MAEILGRKVGMTRVFQEDGSMIPVTLVEATPNTVTQIKTVENDGYQAVALGYRTHKHPTKTKKFHFVREFRVASLDGRTVNQEVKVDSFQEGLLVNVQGVGKGKGFQGVIKRHGFKRGPTTHGSHHHREPGSVGSRKPRLIKPGKRLPGRMGGETVTLREIPVIKIDAAKNLLALKGPIPGAPNGLIKIWSE